MGSVRAFLNGIAWGVVVVLVGVRTIITMETKGELPWSRGLIDTKPRQHLSTEYNYKTT
jgi:cell division protein FtsN